MTPQEKQNILSLHSQSLGYKKIASKLGISPNTVKSFLKKNDNISPTCPVCGKTLEQPKVGRHKVFCSDKCRSRYWLIQHKSNLKYRYTCPHCGEEFTSVRPTRKFCSLECYFSHRFGEERENATNWKSDGTPGSVRERSPFPRQDALRWYPHPFRVWRSQGIHKGEIYSGYQTLILYFIWF